MTQETTENIIDREGILARVQSILDGEEGSQARLEAVCALLRDEVHHYDWVGFYIVEPGRRELVLGPYVGEATEHVRIPFGSGICGQAAETEDTFVVQDVNEQSNYLSCSVNVRSEIVIPIFTDGTISGELDIDSHQVAPFTTQDRELLERICEMVGPLLAPP